MFGDRAASRPPFEADNDLLQLEVEGSSVVSTPRATIPNQEDVQDEVRERGAKKIAWWMIRKTKRKELWRWKDWKKAEWGKCRRCGCKVSRMVYVVD